MSNLYLSRKMATESSRLDDSQTTNSPFVISKSPKISKASVATNQRSDYDVEELEMLLEVTMKSSPFTLVPRYSFKIGTISNSITKCLICSRRHISYKLTVL